MTAVHERWWLWRLKALLAAVVGLFFAVGFLRSLFRYFLILIFLLFLSSNVYAAVGVDCCLPGDLTCGGGYPGLPDGNLALAYSNVLDSCNRSASLDPGSSVYVCPAGVSYGSADGTSYPGYYVCLSYSVGGTGGVGGIPNCVTCSDGSVVCDGSACPSVGAPTPPGAGGGAGVGGTYTGNPTIAGLGSYNFGSDVSLSPTQSISGDVSAVQGVLPNHSPSVGIVSSPPVVAGVTLPTKGQSSQVFAPQLSAYSNSNYYLCDCRQVLSDFFSDVRKSSLFSLASFSGLANTGGGSSSFTFDFGRYGVQTLDFSAHSFAYAIISSILFFLASLLSVRIIVLKR